jgi:hypothetical protein
MTTDLPPGLLAYDEAHVEWLTLAILTAIITTSTIDGTTVLRGREIRDALARALAEFVALEPEAKSKRLIEDTAHHARRLVRHHRLHNNSKVQRVTSRMMRVDLSSGGRG